MPRVSKSISTLTNELNELAELYGAGAEEFLDLHNECFDCSEDHKWNRLCNVYPELEKGQRDKDNILELLAELHKRKEKKGKSKTEKEEKEKVEEQRAIEPPIEGEVSIEELLRIFHKWLYFENDWDITIPVVFAVTNYTNTDPGCLGIIAPSGSYKTELIRAFGNEENRYVFPIDNLTAHTFVSGMKNVEDIIPQLHHRLILIKDFTTLLSKRDDDRTAIFSDIREILDGYLSRSYGSGKRVSYTDIHSSILFGSTGAIERYYSLNATLGQRIIFFKPRNNPTKARERAFENMNSTAEMRKQLHVTMIKFLNTVLNGRKEALSNIGDNIHESVIETLGYYADFVALARTYIRKDYKGEIDGVPEPEFPTRLFKEIVKIVSTHAIIYNREVSVHDIQAGIAVLLSNIPIERFLLLSKLIEKDEGFHTPKLASELHLSRDVTRKRLEELLTLGIIDRELGKGRKGDKYCLKKTFLIIARHLFHFDISIFMWGGNYDRSICVNLYHLMHYEEFNNNLSKDITNNINKEEKIEKEENDTYLSMEDTPTQNYAPCERCGKISYLSEVNDTEIGDRMICRNCKEELKKVGNKQKPTREVNIKDLDEDGNIIKKPNPEAPSEEKIKADIEDAKRSLEESGLRKSRDKEDSDSDEDNEKAVSEAITEILQDDPDFLTRDDEDHVFTVRSKLGENDAEVDNATIVKVLERERGANGGVVE